MTSSELAERVSILKESRMRFKFAALGTRGDVQPLLAVAQSLLANSHAVTFAAAPIFQELIESSGLNFRPLGSLTKSSMMDMLGSVSSVPTEERSKYYSTRLVENDADCIIADLSEFVDDAIFVVNRVVYDLLVASKLRCEIELLTVFLYCPFEQSLVQRLDLDPSLLKIVGIPAWAIPRAIPWLNKDTWMVSGFCMGREVEDYCLPEKLKSYLSDDRKTLVVTMGSMHGFDFELLVSNLETHAKKNGFKIVVQKGWSTLNGQYSDSIFLCNDVPHSALFEHGDFVLHHGGAGTTASVIKAGLGSIVYPQAGDQFYWAWFLEQIGLSLGTLKSECDPQLESMLHRLTQGAIKARSDYSNMLHDCSNEVADYLVSKV
jgi:UDP:flavonoid glycosyltransferase YjiC (YdhE family)